MKKFNWQRASKDYTYTHNKKEEVTSTNKYEMFGQWLAEEIEIEIRDGWCGSDTCFEDHKHKEKRARINLYLEDD